VDLRDTVVQWRTYKHTVNSDFSLKNDTFSTEIVVSTYSAIIMENEFLRVIIVPDYGGRIISIVYKPTGHEQLYQNPIGRPYGPQWDAFYYDWLMVWGGIFPTFSEPEHGKAWCRPWAYEITKNSGEEAAIKMSFKDTINFSKHPSKFKYGATNIVCYFEVSLKAKTSALKTSVTLVNSDNREVNYEYWTNVGVAPGSAPGNTQCDDGTEIIGKINNVKIPSSWADLQKVEKNINEEIYSFEKLRWYKNWTNEGILYGWPVEGNFWGVINHKNNEAIIRVADNSKTVGLKIWTFGYNQSKGFNPQTDINYRRPFIEMWAGVSKEFFSPAKLQPKTTLQFDEYYIITKGLSSFTHANEHVIVNFTTDKKSYSGKIDSVVLITCQYFVTKPEENLSRILYFKDTTNKIKVYEENGIQDSTGPFEITTRVPLQELCDNLNLLVFEIRNQKDALILAEIPISFSNVGKCKVSSAREEPSLLSNYGKDKAESVRKIYSIDGRYLGEVEDINLICFSERKSGIFLVVDRNGKKSRLVLIP
ncbi:MAG: DUF5107 domain-containing protein, partial [Chitinispirillaceae bacterium]|nr:DUF5107 domain-containing protein [Chitinispirillaceae bacterium]